MSCSLIITACKKQGSSLQVLYINYLIHRFLKIIVLVTMAVVTQQKAVLTANRKHPQNDSLQRHVSSGRLTLYMDLRV